MKMEAEIISQEFIKPSSPTPLHNKTYSLSLFDQIVPPIYVPILLYFPKIENISVNSDDFISLTTQQLKHSLSTTLSHFYPLAGRIKESLTIDCNDEGILFVVAKFPYRLSDFLENPDPVACRRHIPIPLTWVEPAPGSPVAMVQVNHFDGGGIAVGVLFLHKIADGISIATFMKSWAAATAATAAHDQAEEILPHYTAQSLFLANKDMQRDQHLFSAMRRYFGFGKTMMRRYVFDAASISQLRARISQPEAPKQLPSRVETVSAFLWKCFMAASAAVSSDVCMTSLVTQNVGIRRRTEPPLVEHSFGNYVWLVPASSENAETDRDMKKLFHKTRDAIGGVDVEFVKRMQGDVGFAGYCTNLEKSLSEFPEKADYLAITSWCNFGLYGVDFGWGRPVWVTKCDGGSDEERPSINMLWLIDTREGDGIEAWLTLDHSYFVEFDKIKEVHDFALIDPSPLRGD